MHSSISLCASLRVRGNIFSILKYQQDGKMRFYNLSTVEGAEKIFTPDLLGEKGEIRIIATSDKKTILLTTDRYGRDISITMEGGKAYIEKGDIKIPFKGEGD